MILVRLLLALILFWALLRVFRAVARMLLRRTTSGGGAPRPGPEEPDSTPLTRGERVIDVEFTEREPGRDGEREPETTRRDG